MIVAGIHTVWHGKIAPAKRKTLQHWRYADRTITLNKGDEMGHFQLGSTVILLFPEHTLQWSTAFQPDSVIKMGQQLANYQTVADASVL